MCVTGRERVNHIATGHTVLCAKNMTNNDNKYLYSAFFLSNSKCMLYHRGTSSRIYMNFLSESFRISWKNWLNISSLLVITSRKSWRNTFSILVIVDYNQVTWRRRFETVLVQFPLSVDSPLHSNIEFARQDYISRYKHYASISSSSLRIHKDKRGLSFA